MIDLELTKNMRVLVVGDAIIDEYVYIHPVGKAVKDNALSAMRIREEHFYGGTWAAAKHTANFVGTVQTFVGTKTMRNTKYVEDTYLQKVLSVHSLEENYRDIDPVDIRGYDCVIVTDFGHGTMHKALIERITREAKFLAVNVQTNSTNYGFNLVTKYPRADLVVIDQLEARLAAQDNESPIEDVIAKLGFERIIVTMGKEGAIGYDGCYQRAVALAENVVDTLGAGDAFLAVVAPYAAAGVPMKDLLRIGNMAAAVKVEIVGHRGSVQKEELRRRLDG